MTVSVYIINNELHTKSSLEMSFDEYETINDIRNKYFQKIIIPNKYEKDKFYFFINDKKVNFNDSIIKFTEGNYKIVGIIVLYDHYNTFNDSSNVMICGKDYSSLNKDFYLYVSRNKYIFEIKEEILNYLKNYNIETTKEKITMIYCSKRMENEKKLEEFIGTNRFSLYTLRY